MSEDEKIRKLFTEHVSLSDAVAASAASKILTDLAAALRKDLPEDFNAKVPDEALRVGVFRMLICGLALQAAKENLDFSEAVAEAIKRRNLFLAEPPVDTKPRA